MTRRTRRPPPTTTFEKTLQRTVGETTVPGLAEIRAYLEYCRRECRDRFDREISVADLFGATAELWDRQRR